MASGVVVVIGSQNARIRTIGSQTAEK